MLKGALHVGADPEGREKASVFDNLGMGKGWYYTGPVATPEVSVWSNESEREVDMLRSEHRRY